MDRSFPLTPPRRADRWRGRMRRVSGALAVLILVLVIWGSRPPRVWDLLEMRVTGSWGTTTLPQEIPPVRSGHTIDHLRVRPLDQRGVLVLELTQSDHGQPTAPQRDTLRLSPASPGSPHWQRRARPGGVETWTYDTTTAHWTRVVGDTTWTFQWRRPVWLRLADWPRRTAPTWVAGGAS